MSRNRPNIEEQRLQVLEVLSEKIQRLDELVRDLRAEKKSDSEKIEQIRITLSNMQGADLNKQVEENKAAINKADDRIRLLENFQNNLTGRLLIIGVLATILAGALSTVVVKLISH